MKIIPIDQATLLTKRLGKAATDRVRYAQQGIRNFLKGSENIVNPVLDDFQELDYKQPPDGLMDILVGIGRTVGDNAKQISPYRVFNILQCMPIINRREIQLMMAIGPRQAQRYLLVIRIALPFVQGWLKRRQYRK